jgi:hypothetical protein
VLLIPLLPFPGRQCFRNLLTSGALQRLAAQGVVLLLFFLPENFANSLLVACLGHSETFGANLRPMIRVMNWGG